MILEIQNALKDVACKVDEVSQQGAIIGILKLEDFFLWFLGCTLVTWYFFVKYKDKLDDQDVDFDFEKYKKKNWENLIWTYLGSFTLLILAGVSGGRLLYFNFQSPTGDWSHELSLVIGVAGSISIEKLIERR